MAADFSDVHLEAVHVPETHRTPNPDHTVTENELPGMVDVYLVIGGGRILFTQYKAGKVFDAIELSKQNAASEQTTTAAPEQTQTQPAPDSGPQSQPEPASPPEPQTTQPPEQV